MATSQLDPQLLSSVRRTQKLLGEHIYKPPLLEKYLAKPPFRFIHDVVCSVINTTGFMKDVFTQDELKYDNVSSAEDKRGFLQKTIERIEASSREQCPARISKILAGKEPENTNKLLQLLAKAISNASKKDNDNYDDAVKKNSKEEEKERNVPATPSSSAETKRAEQKPKEKGSSTDLKKKSRSRPLPKPPANVKKSKANAGSEKDKVSVSDKKSNGKLPKPTLESKPPTTSSPSKTSVASKSNLTRTSSKTLNPRKDSKESGIKPSSSSVSRTPSAIGVTKDKNAKIGMALPPVTASKVPLQRPVSRTKYRQGDGGGGGTNANCSSSKESLSDYPSLDMHHRPSTVTATVEVQESSTDQPNKENPKPTTLNNEHENDEEDDDSDAEAESRESATSSDELFTEHMNKKISEWRTNSAEEEASSTTKKNFAQGWIPSSAAAEGDEKAEHKHVGRVFNSDENCSVDGERKAEKGNPKLKTKEGETNLTISGNGEGDIEMKEAFKRPVTVIMDNEDEDDEDDMYLVQEQKKESLDDIMKMKVGFLNMVSNVGLLSENNRSLLVNQIMETKKELERLNSQTVPDMDKALAERDQELLKEIYLKQIEDLKEAIQKITKCANPLSNITQRSQDDACLMEIEYRKLRQENERLQRKIDEAKAETSRTLYPYTEELINLDKCIEKMEAAIALANQRLYIMDEEYSEDFIEQIAQTPTDDELIEGNRYRRQEEGGPGGDGSGNLIKQHQLWGGIPPAEVLRDDEEHELKMRNTSLRNTFQMAIDMHEIRMFEGNKSKLGSRSGKARLRSKKKKHHSYHQQHQPQHQHHQSQLQVNYGSIMQNLDGGVERDIFGGGTVVAMIPSQRGLQQQINHQHQHHQPQYPQQQQHNFGFGNNDKFHPQQFPQKEPPVPSEIRPSWWD